MEKLERAGTIDDSKQRAVQAKNLVTFFDKTGYLKSMKDPKEKLRIITSMNVEELESMLKRLNGIITGRPIHEREIFTHGNDVLDVKTKDPLHIGAAPEVQRHMFEQDMLDALNKIDMEYVSDFIACSLNFIHMFPDGNGRLSRLVYFILSGESDEMDEEAQCAKIVELLEKSNSEFNFNPGYIYPTLDQLLLSDTPDLTFTEISPKYIEIFNHISKEKDLSEIDVEPDEKFKASIAGLMYEDPVTSVVASKQYSRSSGRNPKDYCVLSEDGLKINAEKILTDMGHNKNTMEWTMIYENVKQWRYKALIDVYKHPSRYNYQDVQMSVRDFVRMKALQKQ